jgi:hypothetical protein
VNGAPPPASEGRFGDRLLRLFTLLALLFLAWRSWKSGENDFVAYFNAGTRVLAGHTPYVDLEATPYRYLPATAYLFAPFALAPFQLARLLLFVANFAAIVAIYRAIRARTSALATALLLLLFAKFHNHDFQNAQVNPLLLLLFFTWWNLRTRNLIGATLAFTVFASFKITPFALCLPLLLFGAWRELAWIMLWSVTLNFLPVFFIDRGPLVFLDWWNQARLIDNPVMLPHVQSLQSAIWWLLEGKVELATFKKLLYPAQLAAFFAILVCAPKDKSRRESWVFASFLAATAVFAPLAWKHHYLMFLPLAALWFSEDPDFKRKRTQALYALAMVGLVVLPSAIGIWNRGFADRLYFLPWTGIALIFLGMKERGIGHKA